MHYSRRKLALGWWEYLLLTKVSGCGLYCWDLSNLGESLELCCAEIWNTYPSESSMFLPRLKEGNPGCWMGLLLHKGCHCTWKTSLVICKLKRSQLTIFNLKSRYCTLCAWNKTPQLPLHLVKGFTKCASTSHTLILSLLGTQREVKLLCVLFFWNAEVDRDLRPLVSQRHLPGYVPPERHCSVGWRKVQADSEV